MESSYLHLDIMYEILSRTSSNTLGRCKVASKEWNKTTYDSKFKKLRSQMTNIVDGFFYHDLFPGNYTYSFVSLNDETISLDFIPRRDVRIRAVSANNGIILCTSKKFRHDKIPFFFVCKPQIKLFQQIPNPGRRFLPEGMAISVFRSNPFYYKILRISSLNVMVNHCQQLILEIFDSQAWKWKRLKDILLPDNVWFFSDGPAVTACGAFHWMLYPNLIFSFDIEKEEWKTIGLPIVKDDHRSVVMAEYEGKLALMHMDMEGYMHTCVLESFVTLEWQKRFVVNMKEPESPHLTYIPVVFYSSDIVVVVSGLRLLKYYDFKNKIFLKEIKLENHYSDGEIFPFCSDSEPCCLKQGREHDIRSSE